MNSSPLLQHVTGASATDGYVEHPTAWHYGDPLGEQRRIEGGATGIIDRFDRVALLVSGPDARGWLNDLISQKVNAIQVGQATYGLILDGNGHVEHYFGILAVEAGLVLDTAAEQAEALEQYLNRMVFWAQVEVQRLELRQIGVVEIKQKGADAAGEGEADAAGEGQPPHLAVRCGDTQLWRTRTLGGIRITDLWVPEERLPGAWDELAAGAVPVGLMAYTAWRIHARDVELGQDTDEKTIPQEVPRFMGRGISGATQLEDGAAEPTEAAVHLNKGCYRGQETVSRVHNLGKSPRVLVLLHLDGSVERLPELGAELTAGGRAIGRVGSSVHDADYGPITLALVRRNVVEKLAQQPDKVPPLLADGIDAAIDSADIQVDDTPRPGREAIRKLRQPGR